MAATPRGYQYPATLIGTPNNPPLHLQQLAESIDADVQGIVDQVGAWTPITLDAGWVADAAHPAPAYRLEDGGEVLRLRSTRITLSPGLAVTAGTTYGIASGGNALPAAARPADGWRYAGGRGYLSAAPATPSPIRITVSSTGEIEFRPTASGTMSAIEWGDSLMYLPGA